MTLLAPIWLWMLLPWAYVCWWAVRRSSDTATVPFISLWPTEKPPAGTRGGPLPVWLICLLAGVLLMIVAAAGPARMRQSSSVTIVVDRSAGLTPSRLQHAEAALRLPAGTRRHVIPLPGQAFDSAGPVDWSRIAPLALSNERAFTASLFSQSERVVLISDRLSDKPAGVQIVRPLPLNNAGIDAFGVTLLPGRTPTEIQRPPIKAQAMVRVWNWTTQTRALLRVDQEMLPIDLPAAGQGRNYFVDLLTVSTVCEASLLTADGRPWDDDAAGDDHAYLVRGGLPAKIEVPNELTPDLRRMVEVYERRRGGNAGGTGDGPRVKMLQGESADELAVVTPRAIEPGDNGQLKIDVNHPITRTADLSGVRQAGRSAVPLTGDGWRVLIRTEDDTPLLAVREVPTRQVWVGFDSGVLADRPAYVVFWTDVFDWLAGAGDFSAEPVRQGLQPVKLADPNLEASPGIYTDGVRQVATFMPAVRPTAFPEVQNALEPVAFIETKSLAVWPMSLALVLWTVGLALYRNLTRF